MGVEALSRGGSFAHFVENDRRALARLRDNLDGLNVPPDSYRIHPRDVATFLAADLAGCAPAPGIVYADAPYESGGAEMVLAHFAANPYAGLELVVIEHGRDRLPESAGVLRRDRYKEFGDSAVSFYSPAEEP
jgi:16S rRNA (guanine966-N2)-methyltransferase